MPSAADYARQKRMRSRALQSLQQAAKAICDEFDRRSDPGTSDLDREQPFHITTTLGVLRDLRGALWVLNEPNDG